MKEYLIDGATKLKEDIQKTKNSGIENLLSVLSAHLDRIKCRRKVDPTSINV